jgi:transcriptional regulator with XRE-family HTH domain
MRAIRILHGKSLEDVAGRLEISVGHLSKLERCEVSPTITIIDGWLELFYMDRERMGAATIILDDPAQVRIVRSA